jgi:aminoglycoside N3'-acetyltransferase
MPPPRSSGDLDQERKSVKKIEEMFDEQGKIEGLIVNLIGDSKLVLIHSSLSSMGFVQGGAESVVEALKSLSKEGLLL